MTPRTDSAHWMEYPHVMGALLILVLASAFILVNTITTGYQNESSYSSSVGFATTFIGGKAVEKKKPFIAFFNTNTQPGELETLACSNAQCSTIVNSSHSTQPAFDNWSPSLLTVKGGNGNTPLLVYRKISAQTLTFEIWAAMCANVNCTSLSTPSIIAQHAPDFEISYKTELAVEIGPDGLPVIAFVANKLTPWPQNHRMYWIRMIKCSTFDCSGPNTIVDLPAIAYALDITSHLNPSISMALDSAGNPNFAYRYSDYTVGHLSPQGNYFQLTLLHCTDPVCANSTESFVALSSNSKKASAFPLKLVNRPANSVNPEMKLILLSDRGANGWDYLTSITCYDPTCTQQTSSLVLDSVEEIAGITAVANPNGGVEIVYLRRPEYSPTYTAYLECADYTCSQTGSIVSLDSTESGSIAPSIQFDASGKVVIALAGERTSSSFKVKLIRCDTSCVGGFTQTLVKVVPYDPNVSLPEKLNLAFVGNPVQ